MDSRILDLLNTFGFDEHPEKPLLFRKQVDETTTAYIDFRKERNGSSKGRRFAMSGEDFIEDPDEIEVLRQFKTERDLILESKPADVKSEFVPANKLVSQQFNY